MANGPVEEAWLDFRKKAIPPEASADQVEDMRLCFYAGATVLWNTIFKLSNGPGESHKDLSLMDSIDKNLHDFTTQKVHAVNRKYGKPKNYNLH